MPVERALKTSDNSEYIGNTNSNILNCQSYYIYKIKAIQLTNVKSLHSRSYLGIVGQVYENGLYLIEYRSWRSASTK